MEEQSFHHYGSKIALKCHKNGKYLAISPHEHNATASGNHPILYVKTPTGMRRIEELTILKFDNREYRGVITFGSAVCFQTSEREYLTFNASGDVKVEKNLNYESGNNNIARLSQWTVIDAHNANNKRSVTPFDDIALRIPFGSFLVVEEDGLISANGHSVAEESTFKLVKAEIPFLPDWLVKRPALNHNSLATRS